METSKQGWKYISAIFEIMQDLTEKKDIIEPQYIFRGITRRHFSRSKKIERYMREKGLLRLPSTPDEILQQTKDYYKSYLYPKAKEYCNETLTNESNAKACLEAMMNNEEIHLVSPDYIKSGAAVRLQENTISNTPHIDYINYINHLLYDAKERFPKYVDEQFTDIEILADLQHKGAASCLVDFSNNFLTSLWFATRGDEKDLGYLYCYDINSALIATDRLSVLDNQRMKMPIADLLNETTKTTKYSGKQEFRFWLWKPSNLNERIARQDSIFVFGLEAFEIEEQNIVTIPIPPDWKKAIQYALKAYFGITAESIFCDLEGYAEANSKKSPYEKVTLHSFSDKYLTVKDDSAIAFNAFQNGMSCLFQSDYRLALKYFSLYESKVLKVPSAFEEIIDGHNISYLAIKKMTIDMEMHFSKGVCFKHLNQPFAAINEYRAVLKYYKVLVQVERYIKENGNNNDTTNMDKYHSYFVNKYHKTINDLMDMYYDTKQYDKIIRTFNYQQEYLMEHPEYTLYSENESIHELGEILTLEVRCLQELYSFIIREDYEINKKTTTISQNENLKYINMENQPFYYVLSLYFRCIMEILAGSDKTAQNLSQAMEACIDDYQRKPFINESFYPTWNMKDINEYIEQIEYMDSEKYKGLMTITSMITDFINFVQGRIRIEPW